MKKTALSLVLLIFSTYVKANTLWCNYKDFFHIASLSHPGIYISAASSDGEVFVQLGSPRSFIIRDGAQCKTGYAHVTLSFNQQNWCVLDIKDGPYLWHPTVYASCHGLEYVDTKYDGLGSNSYTILIK